MFGVMSTYNEELYTTKKVTPNQLSKEQVEWAIKIEKEIASKEQKETKTEEDEEKLFGAVLGTGRYTQENMPKRERATSMNVCGEFSIDEYKKKREFLTNPHKRKTGQNDVNIGNLDALDLNIAHVNEDVFNSFVQFKIEKLASENKFSRDSLIEGFKDFSTKMSNIIEKIEIIQEEPRSVVDAYFQSWNKRTRDEGDHEW